MTEPFDEFDEDTPTTDAEDDGAPIDDPDPPTDPDDPDTGIVVEIAADQDATTWTDLTEDVDLYGGVKEALHAGGVAKGFEIGTGSGFDFEDDAASHSMPVKRAFRIRDTVTSPNTILLRGRVAEYTTARGYVPVEDERAFGVTLVDANAELRGIPIRKWTRPAEDDVDRMEALWQTFLNGDPRPSTDLKPTWIRNANRKPMPARVYENTDPAAVAADCCLSSGKEGFVTEDHEIFYDLPTSTAYAADISITDDAPDGVDSFAPIWEDGDPKQAGGDEFLSGVVVTWTGGRVAKVRSSVETAHDYWREVVGTEAKNSTQADRQATRILDEHAQEEVTYRVAIDLASENVGRIKKGQTISFRAAAASLLSPVTLRIGRLIWEPLAPQFYRCHLELNVPLKLGSRLPGGPVSPEGSIEEDGAAVTLARYQLQQEAGSGPFGPFAGAYDSIAAAAASFGSISAAVDGIVSRTLEGNISWPYTDCGVGTGGVAGLETRAVWHRFTADLSDAGLTGVRVTVLPFLVTGSGYTESPSGFLVGDATVVVGIHTGASSTAAEVTDSEDYVEVGRVGDQGGEVFIPRSLLIDVAAGYNWIVLSPGWRISSNLFFCNSALKPWGYGKTGHDSNGSSIVSAVAVSVSGAGLSNWLPADGAIDGTNATFTLPLWNGDGVPRIRVGVSELAVGEFSYDGSTKTVVLTFAPSPADGTSRAALVEYIAQIGS